ncbi:unnamed protein product [Caenorhabditis sp. 36 PRJEB53466]|nr:unnamed protein product [Caenorhabditis sp. 36 PRJEB53466]
MMGSKQQIGILKRDGIGKQHFDMENILTRSLYRVLNNTNQVPAHIAKTQNVDKMGAPERRTTIAVARPNNHQIGNANSVDMDTQMRLLAQEICGRVERKYERKLEESRDRDRRDTERRLIAIRAEYDAKYELQLKKLEKEKARMEDHMAERERTLEHRMEMRSAEKEHDLAAKQRMVENRAIELTLNKENFEKMRDDFQRRVEGEMEELRLERERIEVTTTKTTERRRTDLAVEAEAKMWKKRTEELEHDANETRKKIGEMMEENFRLRDQIGSAGQLRKELDVTMTSLKETREELAASKEENDQLRMEIERLRLQISQRIKSAVDETIAEYSAKEAKWKRLAGLSQQRIAVLTEKFKDIEMERDVLRQELKTVQKMVGRGSVHRQHQKKPSKVMFRSVSPSESNSSLSDGEMEILNIRQRIQNLDEIAKELDASVEHISMTTGSRKAFDRNESNVELYDDFCRALHSAVLDDEGSPKTSSPQKPIVRRLQSEEHSEEKNERDEWLKRGMRVVSPPSVKNIESKPEGPKVQQRTIEEVKPVPAPVPVRVEKREKPNELEMSEFEKKLQARGRAIDQTERRNQLFQLATEPESQPEPVKTEEPPKSTSADNPMFAGVDPVMAEYMKKVLAARNEQNTARQPIQSSSTPSVAEPPRPRQVEMTLADELDLELDQPITGADDDWW